MQQLAHPSDVARKVRKLLHVLVNPDDSGAQPKASPPPTVSAGILHLRLRSHQRTRMWAKEACG
jgi:hypothetical protein